MLWVLVTAALAQNAAIFSEPEWQDYEASRSHAHVPGRLGVQATVYEMGANMDDVMLVTAEVRRGSPPPARIVEEGSGWSWRQEFGRDTLTVRQERLADGHLVAEYRSRESGMDPAWEAPTDRICASAPRTDSRPLELRTWDERLRPHAGEAGRATSLYLIDDGESARTALVYLAPGDSVTIVEVVGGPKHHPKRRIELDREQHGMEIKESDRRQQVCIEG